MMDLVAVTLAMAMMVVGVVGPAEVDMVEGDHQEAVEVVEAVGTDIKVGVEDGELDWCGFVSLPVNA
jgi:hypothetical protein